VRAGVERRVCGRQCRGALARVAGVERPEAGFAALELAIGMAILAMVAMVTVTLTTWPERASTGRRVARVAAQAAAQETSWSAAQAAGESAATEAASNYGLSTGDFTVSLEGSIERDGAVTATVAIRMPAIAVPGIANAGEWTWTTSSTQAAGAYRSLP
jgi:Flp pilus assembly protein TadG